MTVFRLSLSYYDERTVLTLRGRDFSLIFILLRDRIMKTLSEGIMIKRILVTGLNGAGKSTLGRALAESLGAINKRDGGH